MLAFANRCCAIELLISLSLPRSLCDLGYASCARAIGREKTSPTFSDVWQEAASPTRPSSCRVNSPRLSSQSPSGINFQRAVALEIGRYQPRPSTCPCRRGATSDASLTSTLAATLYPGPRKRWSCSLIQAANANARVDEHD